MKLRVALLGTRGIPNYYGRSEHISEYVSAGLVKRGHEVTVYNTHSHPYTAGSWNGVEIRCCYEPGYLPGIFGQFIYELNCLLDARKRNYDVIMLMDYSRNSLWGRLYPPKSAIITHMGGLEWKREKYTRPVMAFMRYAEKMAVKHSQYYVVNSMLRQTCLQDKYHIESKYIPYGADLFFEMGWREQFDRSEVFRDDYFLLMPGTAPQHKPFHKSVIDTDAFYPSSASEVRYLVETMQRMEIEKRMVNNDLKKLKDQFNWETIVDRYEEFLLDCYYNYNLDRAIYY
ncbi:protein of unknown function [Pedobacter westerhofensis]|uniref:DUF1972 domain-containing protein n=1 Tax=Pedobacter westerhofensis TaxID=425512 RepID=A0A521DGS1_9SPHI|nr:DUF1972 domain-containing protein [Pedobacter westerhofensis]SMO70828.1 protein of unknown function [Pedobacter westerhofensis]